MKYLKHYWISVNTGTYSCTENPVEKRHPEAEFPGLDVKIWMHDEDGVDVCLSAVPDTTSVTDVVCEGSTKKAVQVLTEEQFNSVAAPYFESQTLYSQVTGEDGQENEEIKTQADLKLEESKQALYSL